MCDSYLQTFLASLMQVIFLEKHLIGIVLVATAAVGAGETAG